MSLAIHPVSPRDPRAIALLTESHALMNALFPPEENHFLDIDALCCESITLFGAEECGELLGCAALARRDGYGEVKSMFVAPEARGIGVARRLLDRLERTAREELGFVRVGEEAFAIDAPLRTGLPITRSPWWSNLLPERP